MLGQRHRSAAVESEIEEIRELWPRLTRYQRCCIIARIAYYNIKNRWEIHEKAYLIFDSMLVGFLTANIVHDAIVGTIAGFLFLSYATSARYILRR